MFCDFENASHCLKWIDTGGTRLPFPLLFVNARKHKKAEPPLSNYFWTPPPPLRFLTWEHLCCLSRCLLFELIERKQIKLPRQGTLYELKIF
jgi:hypothetical protein